MNKHEHEHGHASVRGTVLTLARDSSLLTKVTSLSTAEQTNSDRARHIREVKCGHKDLIHFYAYDTMNIIPFTLQKRLSMLCTSSTMPMPTLHLTPSPFPSPSHPPPSPPPPPSTPSPQASPYPPQHPRPPSTTSTPLLSHP